MKTKTPQVNPNPKPFNEWILRPTNAWPWGSWLFSEDGTTGYWEFAIISQWKTVGKERIKKTMDEIKQEAKEAYEMFYGKSSTKKVS